MSLLRVPASTAPALGVGSFYVVSALTAMLSAVQRVKPPDSNAHRAGFAWRRGHRHRAIRAGTRVSGGSKRPAVSGRL
jgi:hypothetical protein